MSKFRAILSAFLCLAVLAGLTGCAGRTDQALEAAVQLGAETLQEAVSSGGRAVSGALSRENAVPAGQHGQVSWADMDYYHYEPELFYQRIEDMRAAGESGDAERVVSLYDWLYNEYVMADTLGSVAYLRYSADVTEGYWSDERVYCDNLWSEMGDALCTVCRDVLQGSCSQQFEDHIGSAAASYCMDYEPMTDREVELSERETQLVNDYYEIMDGADSIVYARDGENWTMERLNGRAGDQLYIRDYDSYLETYYGVLKAINDRVGPIYVELVQIRDEIAQLQGYDNYTDYAYEKVFCRDYDARDAQLLCDAVKDEVSHAYYSDEIYGSPLWYGYESVGTDMDAQALLSMLGAYSDRVDGSVTEAWRYMTEYGLYDIAAGDGRMQSCYTTTLNLYHAPFIYMDLYGDCYDVSSMTHEFGHYVDAFCNQPENLLTDGGSFDLFEIHSNGLEMLFLAFYDEIFGDGADTARFINLAEQVRSVVDGCIYDEFQRRVYAQPDMSLDEINRLYRDICAQYGEYEPDDVDYYWMYVSHNYESPLYYISYAVSALAALQIWDLSQTDYDAAVALWLRVLGCGAYEQGYLEVLEDCGMRSFLQDGTVEDVCLPALDCLARLGGAANGAKGAPYA